MRRLKSGLITAALIVALAPAGLVIAQEPPGDQPAPQPTPAVPPQAAPPAHVPPAVAPPPAPAPAPAPQPAPAKSAGPSKFFAGGGFGLSFGDVNYYSFTPWMGYWINPKLNVGAGLEYTYREDNRTDPSLSTSDYGANVFSRLTIGRGLFAAAEYEWLKYERYATSTNKVTDNYSAVFVGGGLYRPTGKNSALVMQAMYNLNYTNDGKSPYDSPYVVSVGLSVGF